MSQNGKKQRGRRSGKGDNMSREPTQDAQPVLCSQASGGTDPPPQTGTRHQPSGAPSDGILPKSKQVPAVAEEVPKQAGPSARGYACTFGGSFEMSPEEEAIMLEALLQYEEECKMEDSTD